MQTADTIKSKYEDKLTRVKNLFKPNSEGKYNKNLFLVSQCTCAGSLAGFLIGGRIGGRVGAIEHIENTTLAVYQSTAHAQREYHGRVVLGFLRNGSKFGWRAGVFSGLYSLLLVMFNEAHTQNNSASNFLYAGAFTGIIYKSLAGWRSKVVGAIIGSALSLPPAGFTAAVNTFATEDVKRNLSIFHDTEDETVIAQDAGVSMPTVTKDTERSELDDVISGLSKSIENAER